MKKRLLAVLLTASMVFCNTSFLYAAEEGETAVVEEASDQEEKSDVLKERTDTIGTRSDKTGEEFAHETEGLVQEDLGLGEQSTVEEWIIPSEDQDTDEIIDNDEPVVAADTGENESEEEEEIASEEDGETTGEEGVIASGACGDNISWVLEGTGDNLTLVLSGSGEMDEFTNSSIPWALNRARIRKVIISEGITKIGKYSFYSLYNLVNVKLPNSLTIIDAFAFQGCRKLESIIIPDGVTCIWDYAFEGCSSLTSISIPAGVEVISFHTFQGCSSLTSITIPDGVKQIYGNAFYNCSNLKSITIPSSVIHIGSKAFEGCSNLTEICIPEKVALIEHEAFKNCICLKDVTLPDGLSEISYGTFEGCSSLTNVTLPSKLSGIDFRTFYGCTSLESIIIPPYAAYVGFSAFEGCTRLRSVLLPDSVTSIGNSAFSGCSSLLSITIPESVMTIGSDPFYNCPCTLIVVAGSYVEEYAKEHGIPYSTICKAHIWSNEYTVDQEATCIEEGSESIHCSVCDTIDDSTVRVIPKKDHAYSDWTVTKDATCIETGSREKVCADCGDRETETIPATGHQWEEKYIVDKEPTEDEDGIESIHCSLCGAIKEGSERIITYETGIKEKGTCGDNASWELGYNGTLYIRGTGPIQYCGYHTAPWNEKKDYIQSVIIEDGITSVGAGAFEECINIKNVSLPASLTTIEGYAFYDCKSIQEITIPSRVVTIETTAFSDCTGIKELIIPESVREIGDGAFWNCTGLNSITIPDTEIHFGDRVFSGVTGVFYIKKGSGADEYLTSESCTIQYICTYGHTWNDDYTVDSDPTCTEDGRESIHCSICNQPKEGTERAINKLGHDFVGYHQIKEVSCEEDGLQEKWCSRCGSTGITEVVPALGHNFNKITVAKEPTCTETGIREKQCSYCDDVIEEIIPAIGHKWDEELSVDKEATCTEDGQKSIHCGICGEIKEGTEEKLEKLGHDFAGYHQIKEATCEEDGIQEKWCSRCGSTGITEVVPAFGHYYNRVTVTKEPTCTEAGTREKQCIYCDDVIEEVIPASGHQWGTTYTVDKTATCTEEGSESIHCSVCDAIDESTVRAILKKAHTYSDWTVTKAATCTEAGSQEKVCVDCGDKVTEEIPATGHQWETAYTVDRAATCTAEGSESIHCSVCDAIDETTSRAIPKKAHAYGDWTVTKAATCTEAGSQEKVCADCGDKITETIPATGHQWKTAYTVDKEATCTEEGTESIHCSVCDEKKEGSERAIEKLEHTFGSWTVAKEPTATEPGTEERSCTLCGEKEQREYWEGYDITYVLNGGTNHAENPNSYYKKATITLKNPSKTGYTFNGWYSDAKFKKKVTTVSGGDKTVYAKWTVNKYNITFNGNGSTSGKMKKMSGIAYDANKALTGNAFKRNGYNFIGWNTAKDGSGTSYTNKQSITKLSETNGATINLYAQWEIIPYTISYNLGSDDAVNSDANPTSYDVTTAITLQAPTRPFSTFQGWYSDKKLKKKATTIKKGSTGNKTFYAKWTTNKYTISFKGNGATSGKMKDLTGIVYNADKTLTANAFKRTGYHFVEWNTAADGSGTSYANKQVVNGLSTENGVKIVLYAIWEKDIYTISYVLNGSDAVNASENPATYDVETAVTLTAPTREHYTFNGWYSDKKLKKKASTIKKGSTGNKTFYAKWTPNKYTIAYNGNGSTGGKMKNTTGVAYGSSKKLTGNAYSRKGYKFIGWNTAADGSGTSYANKASVLNLAEDNGVTVTLYAQWEIENYKVTYNLNGGTAPEEGNPATYTVADETITLAAPAKTGYTFSGWYSDKKLKKKAPTITKGSTGNKTFYAKWTANKYTIVFDGNGATSGSTKKISGVAYGSSKKLTANGFKKTGATFLSWNTEPDGSGTTYKNKASVKNLTAENGATVTLYAVWSN